MHRALSRRAFRACALALGLATTTALAAAPAAGAKPHALSWVGTGPSADWSSPDNWSAGVVPSGTVTTLYLPSAGSDCSGQACEFGIDDIPSLTVGTLQIDAGANYFVVPLTGDDAIGLQNGVVFAPATSGSVTQQLATTMAVPVTLEHPQAWTIQGKAGTPTQLTTGPVLGGYPLALNLSQGVSLVAPELDSGAVTVSGDGTLAISAPDANPIEGPSWPAPLLSGRGVTLRNGASLAFRTTGVVSGPITFARGSYSNLELGRGAAPDGTATVVGPVTLRAFTTVSFDIDQSAAVGNRPLPGADYSQLSDVGDVDINGASLNLSQGFSDGQDQCAALKGGETYTLIAASGKINGTFDGAANGQVVTLGPCNPLAAGAGTAAVVRYNTRRQPETVTATTIGPAQITQLVGQSLALSGADAEPATLLKHNGYTETYESPAAGNLALTWTAVARGRRVTVATAALDAGRVGPFRLPIRLTAAGRQLLRRSKQVTVTATASLTPTGQKPVRVSRKLRLS